MTRIDAADNDMERIATIRLSHLDIAGIVFYPRYFELLGEYFPESPLSKVPFAYLLKFIKPNHLGDQIRIVHRHNRASDAWSFTGCMGDAEHFSIHSLPSAESQLGTDAHSPGAPTFRAETEIVGAWAAGHDGFLHISRYYELNNVAVEQWFDRALNLSFHELHTIRRNGIPTVELQTRCRELPRLGDSIQMWIRPTHIGNRSVHYKTWLLRDDVCLMETEQKIVFVSLNANGFESEVLPDALRQRLGEQMVRQQ